MQFEAKQLGGIAFYCRKPSGAAMRSLSDLRCACKFASAAYRMWCIYSVVALCAIQSTTKNIIQIF